MIAPRRMSRREARDLGQRVVKERLDRDLSADEADRLADAVLRLRAAADALRAVDDSPAGIVARRQNQDALRDALEEIADVTGLPVADLGPAFAGGENAR